MTDMAIEIGMLTGLVAGIAALLAWGSNRFPRRAEPLVDAINDLLPQTQCAQCGYPGCRPYAEAVARGGPIDLCPPGGEATQRKLAGLLGRAVTKPLPTPAPVVARIDESRCVGCFLCVEACPVDAIVGAPRFLHTVVRDRCTGCELCLPPCPVDCIELVPVPSPPQPVTPRETAVCIRCNRCEPVCPESLPVARLWWTSRGDDLSAAVAAGLELCVECGLCNPECPSGLDLVGTFRAARGRLAREADAARSAALAKQAADGRNERLARQAAAAADRRSARLARLRHQAAPPARGARPDG